MDRYRCPACGASGYRQSRCSQCLYVPFGEEIAHRNHYHAGEPLVTDSRRAPVAPGKGCDSYPGKRMPKIRIPRPLLYLLAIGVAVFVPGGVFLVIIGAILSRILPPRK